MKRDMIALFSGGWDSGKDVAAGTVRVRMFLIRLNPNGIYSQTKGRMVHTVKKEGGNSAAKGGEEELWEKDYSNHLEENNKKVWWLAGGKPKGEEKTHRLS
jgi:hypothetical protein